MSSFFDRMCVLMRSIHLPGPGPVRYAVYADIDIAILQEYNVTLKKGGWGGGGKKGQKASNVYSYIFTTKGVFTDGGPGHLGRPRPCFQLKPTCWLAGGCWILLLLRLR